MSNPDQLESYARTLEESGQYRVLRRLEVQQVPMSFDVANNERLAIILDTETTGLDRQKDEVIELGMIAFTYDASGSFRRLIGTFDEFNEPTVPITPEITGITGITDAMVSGRRLPINQVTEFVEHAALIIAHNAAFDRPFCERLSPVFGEKAWACSATEVPWRELGFEGVKLTYLLNQCGYFHDGHRALDDAFALLKVLFEPSTDDGRHPFQFLIQSARETRFRIRCRAKYEFRSQLRARGYRWSGQPDGKAHWYKDFNEASVTQEIVSIGELFRIPKEEIRVDRMTAVDRYREERSS